MLNMIILVLLMMGTVFFGPQSIYISLGVLILTFISCLIYQVFRHKVSWYSFGEEIISNLSKTNIMEQNKVFLISRIPLHILMIFTIIIFANLNDQISEGWVFTIGNVGVFGLVVRGVYYSMIKFSNAPTWKPIALIIFLLGLILVGVQMRIPDSDLKTIAVYLYSGVIIAWVLVGSLYLMKENPTLKEV